jgi:U3 small nucleolar RNA-associated protein 20
MTRFATLSWVRSTFDNLNHQASLLGRCSTEELKALAIEVQELTQAKVGAAQFSAVYNQIRQGLLGVRRDRKTARALLVCPNVQLDFALLSHRIHQISTNPEAAAKRRLARNSNKKESRKRKDVNFM